MKIQSVEVYNFRKLHKAKLDLSSSQTLLVGANNSGKTSAMVALRCFLKDRGGITAKDVTASNWKRLEAIANSWLEEDAEPQLLPLIAELPYMDVWLHVSDNELHHVAHLIPSLEWKAGLLGVRIRLEPKTLADVFNEYRDVRKKSVDRLAEYAKTHAGRVDDFSLWPKSFQDFLDRRMSSQFTLNAYLLDPNKPAIVQDDDAIMLQPQVLSVTAQGLGPNPFSGLLQIREIKAQRGFADASDTKPSSDDDTEDRSPTSKRKLSDQLQAYYRQHLDPDKDPTQEDVSALGAFHTAQKTFDERLLQGFSAAIGELEMLGYPGIANPKMSITTRIKPTDGLNHPSAVQYDISGGSTPLRLPEDYNGLGFQNLISMVFLLMRFRDDWMLVGKHAGSGTSPEQDLIAPLQLVLIEEPEAHLHAQVQQVFMRRAMSVLRNHRLLKDDASPFSTQLVVSTHSSHIAHEVEFADLRYFKRKPANSDCVATSDVANLSGLFGTDDETTRFAKRYLRTTHCDLFFADGAIMIEGAAERILLPHFISNSHKGLAERYISLLEIGGSHAHRLKPLVELLDIPTLIISDLDAIDPKNNRKSVLPAFGAAYETANSVLKSWLPKLTLVDDLLAEDDVPELAVGGFGHIGVVYQRSQTVQCEGDAKPVHLVPSTFEDALVLANLDIVRGMSGVSMSNAFAEITNSSKTAEGLVSDLYQRLSQSPQKAAFALDLLSIEKIEDLTAPPYIAKGLNWLEKRLTAGDTT
ncbi:AAA family ATPase [Aliiroseovarius subalbicans]|uniref:AAA family ATPase n=1 Tax=Aliiroseovarius subalbicans TaxID=2925840 RepID=UPI001F588424|nr:AAA family ATPase [Aliiroseovarius subalbicans]MCI2400875.1 AAA family ATPase [Aliiroseovarius subalbicans]